MPGSRCKAGRRLHGAEAQLPPPTRRGVLLIDPSYEIKTDYTRVLAALREALTRFAECTVVIWLPQLQLLEAASCRSA
jgi:23S rRNA (adenine2030-N6)-methyltransferase